MTLNSSHVYDSSRKTKRVNAKSRELRLPGVPR